VQINKNIKHIRKAVLDGTSYLQREANLKTYIKNILRRVLIKRR
jgi:hypothetical protein